MSTDHAASRCPVSFSLLLPCPRQSQICSPEPCFRTPSACGWTKSIMSVMSVNTPDCFSCSLWNPCCRWFPLNSWILNMAYTGHRTDLYVSRETLHIFPPVSRDGFMVRVIMDNRFLLTRGEASYHWVSYRACTTLVLWNNKEFCPWCSTIDVTIFWNYIVCACL